MAGLGESITGLGNALFQHGLDLNKQKMLDKLEQGKEKRDEDRTKRQEERAKQNYKETKTFQTADGSWMEQDYNAAGEPMSDRPPRPASPDRVQSLTNQQQTEKISLENAVLGNKKSQFEVENMGEDKALERENIRSEIGYRQQRGLAGIMTAARPRAGDKEDAPKVPSEAANVLMEAYGPLIEDYTSAGDGDTAPLSRAEVEEIAVQSVRSAALQKVDAATLFRDELERRAKTKTSTDKLNFR